MKQNSNAIFIEIWTLINIFCRWQGKGSGVKDLVFVELILANLGGKMSSIFFVVLVGGFSFLGIIKVFRSSTSLSSLQPTATLSQVKFPNWTIHRPSYKRNTTNTTNTTTGISYSTCIPHVNCNFSLSIWFLSFWAKLGMLHETFNRSTHIN